jgi:quercetin dioxygenase-like cupin family protein
VADPRTVVPPKSDPLPGDFGVTVRVRSEDTGGVMSVVEETLTPKSFIIPHVHQNDVWVYVLSGEIGVLVGEDVVVASTGEWALKPRDIPHAMWNPSSTPARIIEVLTPAGSERWFEEVTHLEPDDHEGFAASCRKYGLEFLPDSPWVAELRHRFGLEGS